MNVSVSLFTVNIACINSSDIIVCIPPPSLLRGGGGGGGGGGEGHEKPIYSRFTDLRGLGEKERGLIPQCTLWILSANHFRKEQFQN